MYLPSSDSFGLITPHISPEASPIEVVYVPAFLGAFSAIQVYLCVRWFHQRRRHHIFINYVYFGEIKNDPI